MSSMLLTHRGAIRLDRAQLANSPAPEPTDTNRVILSFLPVGNKADLLDPS